VSTISEFQPILAEATKCVGVGVNMQKLNNMLMQLRKNCNHPDIITADYDQTAVYPPADELVAQAGKMQLLERLLVKLKPKGHKVLIFSQV
jgi:ATP-dependent DNA helicase